ncbi:MAG: SIS domain-containing protein [Bacteroidales bacterium]|nr:SIS domain-containing protein [Bacteroidales bacterium]
MIKTFLSENNVSKDSEIILTGAGTSAFIGNVLESILLQKGFSNCKAVATTDIITHPGAYFSSNREIILVSFARSGNSPESLATVEIANAIAKKVLHIVITCNKEGRLAKTADNTSTLLLFLPPETNDQSLAMTSSFSTMMLAFLLLTDIEQIEKKELIIRQLCEGARKMLDKYEQSIEEIAGRDFSRAIFLGSGELKGIAEECHLKLQELTDGDIICKFDSFLGFRHGPKAVINEESILIYLLSSNKYIQQYEKDLIKQINLNNRVVAQVAVSADKAVVVEGVEFDLQVSMDNLFSQTKEYSFIPYVIIGQLLGFFKSLSKGLNPDNPSISGNISRVVKGVFIYDLPEKNKNY